ncbi:MAG TPA: ribosome-binding factor A [Candidatus Fimivivens sp.]|nr:ribosome-binding factor A [Candidatus Fimivivens sp.]
MSKRILQINDLIRELLGDLVLREVAFKTGTLVTITRTDTSADLRHSRVFVSIYPEQETGYALKTLEHERKKLQGALHRKLHMKPLPLISFHSDTTERNADIVERIIIGLK